MSRALRQRRERARRARVRRAQISIFLVVVALAALAGGAWATYDYLRGPEETWPTIKTLKPQRVGENSIVFAGDGSKMGVIQSNQNRSKIRFKAMGEWAPKATVAIEDERFYEHKGVDPQAVLRAFITNAEAGDTKEGASTITQQVVRNLYKEITTEKTLSRKAKEATLALELEEMPGWNKEKILETYLNLVFYGNNAYGIEAAAKTYFSKKASALTIPEAALLAGLPQQPSVTDPFNPKTAPAAKARRNDVLAAMYEQRMITRKEYEKFVAAPVLLKATREYKQRRLPYFFDYVEQDLIGRFGAETVRAGGLRIRTTIDPEMQALASQAVNDTLGGGDVQGAIAVLDTKSGEIRAMASSSNYRDSKFNRAAQAKRQPGSTAKIWVLAAFLREGVNPDSTYYVSRPIQVRYKGSGEAGWWKPKTYSNSYSGNMSIRSATTASDNAVYAQMTLDVTPEKVAETAYKLGVRFDKDERKALPLENVWSIGLGSQVVTPLEQTNFYATIARGGIRIDPRAVRSATTAAGTKLTIPYPKGHRVLEDWQADSIVDILTDNICCGTGGAAAISGEQVSGKTGTTDDSKDAWFCGMTPELTACVWIGHNIPTPMYGETGGGRPAQIWRRFMEPALDLEQVEDRDWFEVDGDPTWIPWVSTWKDNPSFDVIAGANPDDAPKKEEKEDEDKPAANAGATPDPVTPAPDPVTPAPDPVTPAPDPVTPAPDPVTPAPDPGAGGGAGGGGNGAAAAFSRAWLNS